MCVKRALNELLFNWLFLGNRNAKLWGILASVLSLNSLEEVASLPQGDIN
jgi:hypothetical protein